jgi:hypothetical protein
VDAGDVQLLRVVRRQKLDKHGVPCDSRTKSRPGGEVTEYEACVSGSPGNMTVREYRGSALHVSDQFSADCEHHTDRDLLKQFKQNLVYLNAIR